MPYTKAISPVSNSYLTKGKEYEIIWITDYEYIEDGFVFSIESDNGVEFRTTQHNSYHIGGLSWQLK